MSFIPSFSQNDLLTKSKLLDSIDQNQKSPDLEYYL